MTISQIRLLNFRNWTNEHWQNGVPLKPMTLVLGRNSAGKTSILQPLRLLKQTAAAKSPGRRMIPMTSTCTSSTATTPCCASRNTQHRCRPMPASASRTSSRVKVGQVLKAHRHLRGAFILRASKRAGLRPIWRHMTWDGRNSSVSSTT